MKTNVIDDFVNRYIAGTWYGFVAMIVLWWTVVGVVAWLLFDFPTCVVNAVSIEPGELCFDVGN